MQLFQEKVGRGVVFQVVNLKGTGTDIPTDSRRFVQRRFESFCSPVLKAAAVITDYNLWPRIRDQLRLYGEEDVVVLDNHYRDVLNRSGYP